MSKIGKAMVFSCINVTYIQILYESMQIILPFVPVKYIDNSSYQQNTIRKSIKIHTH